MRTFHNQHNSQVKSFNDKIIPNLAEYYYLEDLEELGKVKSFNINKYYINEKYHLKIKYIAANKKLYSRVYPREGFHNKYVFIKIENKLDPKNIKSMKFALLYKNYIKMNEFSLLKKIAKSGYANQILANINIDFTVKKKYYYLVENPILYPEEQCNMKYNIVDDEYLFKFMEEHKKNLDAVKNSKGILPNMKVKISENKGNI
jgi:hypothetical protein